MNLSQNLFEGSFTTKHARPTSDERVVASAHTENCRTFCQHIDWSAKQPEPSDFGTRHHRIIGAYLGFTQPAVLWWLVSPKQMIQGHPRSCQFLWAKVGGWATPLKNMSSSIGMMTFPIFLGKENWCSKPPTRYSGEWTLGLFIRLGVPKSTTKSTASPKFLRDLVTISRNLHVAMGQKKPWGSFEVEAETFKIL